ncbi:MAG: hypothetical protein K2Y37_13930 [Pirellulales bacterium]|nr:hypothetical protein [Pirellulales bacterium]
MARKSTTTLPSSPKVETLASRREVLEEQFGYLLRAFERQYEEVALEVRQLTAREIPGAKRVSRRLASRLGTFKKELLSKLQIFWRIARSLLEEQHRGDMKAVAAEFRKALDDFEAKYWLK